jgi:trk system potassium uptake protein TrkH
VNDSSGSNLPSKITVSQRSAVNPGRLLALGYVIVIAVGTGLLSLPFASHGCSLIDALFTATSATCVTGLIVKVTPHDFTLFGQIVILALIQIGGLGYMTLSSALFFLLGRRISLRQRILMKESINFLSYGNLRRFAFMIFKVTMMFEAAGAIILIFWFRFRHGMAWDGALYHGIFQSVSAFCNAGFSTFPDNLARFKADPLVGFLIPALFIIGGLGFIVISDVWKRMRRETLRIATHTRLVLTTTAVLIIGGTLLILITEFTGVLGDLSWPAKILNAFFTAATPRTAGFNLAGVGGMRVYTLLILMLLMFIGASPGGTGGGIKTTSVALAFAEIGRVLRRRGDVVMMRRTIKPEQIHRATTLVILGGLVVLTSFLLLVIFNRGENVMNCAFEAFSAFGTVGLSTGSATSPYLSFAADLSTWGKLIIIFTMFFGRVGTLTLGSALVKNIRSSRIRPAKTNIVVG